MLRFGHGNESTAAEAALVRLRDRILTGELEPGTKLNQASLAQDLGMSRIPVRDAIRALAAEGLVSHDPRRTAVVTPLSLDDVSELYELRIAVEPHASALGLPHLGEEQLSSIAGLLDDMSGAEGSSDWLAAHDRFHASLYQSSGRPRMVALLDRARAQTRRYTWIRHDRNPTEIEAEHELILSAVKRRDASSLQVMIEAHLTSSFHTVRRQLAERFPDRFHLRGGDAQRATA